MEEKQKKMKNWVCVHPRKSKEWIIAILMLANIIWSVSPIVNLYNTQALVFGAVPAFLILAMVSIIVAAVIIGVAYKWRVF